MLRTTQFSLQRNNSAHVTDNIYEAVCKQRLIIFVQYSDTGGTKKRTKKIYFLCALFCAAGIKLKSRYRKSVISPS